MKLQDRAERISQEESARRQHIQNDELIEIMYACL